MLIRDAARHLGVSTRTLRHYEAAGLIRPTRLGNGYRNLSEADVRTAAWVRDLIAAGFSTRELRGLLATFDERQGEAACVAALRGKLAQIDRLVEVLQQRRRAVAQRLAAQEALTPQPARPASHQKETLSREGPEHPRAALPPARQLRGGCRLP